MTRPNVDFPHPDSPTEAERLARRNVESDTVHGPDHVSAAESATGWEVLVDVGDRDQRSFPLGRDKSQLLFHVLTAWDSLETFLISTQQRASWSAATSTSGGSSRKQRSTLN